MVAPNNSLEYLEVPGLAEARQKEALLRDRAFLPIEPAIAGIPVKPFCLRHLLALDYLKNGFVVPCQFERPSERVAHAIQFLGIVSPLSDIAPGAFLGLRVWFRGYIARRFIRRVLKASAAEVFTGIAAYLDEAFYDCPRRAPGSSSQFSQIASASFMASMVDDLIGAGYAWSEEAIFNLPLVRLWQYWRMSLKRLDPDLTMSNPSDRLSDEYIARLNAERAASAALPQIQKDSHA